jgi:PKD repeat protein
MNLKLITVIVLAMMLVGVLPTGGSFAVVNSKSGSANFMAQTDPVDWWPMFHHDLTHTGYSASTAPKTNQVLWNYTTGNYVFSSPAVADGKIFVGSADGNVYALNETTGDKIWDYTTGDWVFSSPAVSDGKVFVGSWDKNVYALNETTGDKIWNYTTGYVATGYVLESSPAVADGKVFIGSYDKNVYALNELTGAKIWNYTTSDAVHSSPAVADGMVFIGSLDGKVYAFEPALLCGPTASFTYEPLTPIANQTVTFNASTSLPGWNGTHEVPIANYTWDFGDGNVTTVAYPIINHTYTAVGTYKVNLTVTCEDDPVLIDQGIASSPITVKDIQVIPEFSTWTSMLLILIVLTVAVAIYKRRLLKALIH